MLKRFPIVIRQANNVLTRHGFNIEISAGRLSETLRTKYKRSNAPSPSEIESVGKRRQKLKASIAYKDFQDMGSLRPFRPKHP